MFFFLAALALLIRLRRFENPTGADGFFYLKQIESLSSFEGFYYKDYSFAFALPSFLNFFVHDSLLAFQISVAFVFGGIAWIVDRIAPRGWIFRLISLAFYFYSLMYLELTLVFLKTATGVFFLLLAAERFQKKKLVMSATAIVFAVLSHKLMIVLGAGLALAWFAQKRPWLWLTSIPLAGLAFLYPRLGHHIVQAWRDVTFEKFTLAFIEQDYSVSIFAGLLVLAAAGLIYWKREAWPLAVGLLLPVVFPDTMNSQSISFRLMMVSAPLFVLSAAYLKNAYGWALITSAIALNVHYDRPMKTWENPWARMIPETAELEKVLPNDALLYAPHGAEFYLAYKTKFRPRSFIIREVPDEKTFRLAYVRPYLRKGTMLENDLNQMTILKVSENFWLFKETTWLALEQLHLFFPHAMNTLESRPDFVANY